MKELIMQWTYSWQAGKYYIATFFAAWLLFGQALKALGSDGLLKPFPEEKTNRSIRSAAAVTFIREPEDLQVCVGDSASFPCLLAGTSGVPFWGINDGICTIRSLPDGFKYTNSTLIIENVKTSDHGTVIQCYHYVLKSRNATLSVISEGMDFGTTPGHRVCNRQAVADNFPVSFDLLEQLREQSGNLLSMNLNIPCGRFNQLILINANTGFPDSLEGKKNTLILIDPSKGPVWLNLATLEQDDSHLALVGLPAEPTLASSGLGLDSGLLPSDSDRAIVMIPADQRLPAIKCFNPWARCHFENLSFRQEGLASVEASPVIELEDNLDSSIKNCDFSGSRTFVQQLNSRLLVIASEFYVNSTYPAVIADQETSICASSFYCDGQCDHAILLTPNAGHSSVKISALAAQGFPAAVVISSEKNSAGAFVAVSIANSTIISNEEDNSTAIQLYGNLDVSLERNNITGCVMILNPGEEECIKIEENDSFFIQIENSEETTYMTPAQTENSGEIPAYDTCTS